ncbi:hypothetical protein OKW33_005198 [Paraburkholderia atlantica]|uniref:hypothetical protein n=1 Tax=Paraburkholderia atlantica TaxID=2654982 RepID=UPI0015906FD8|nr:hypothetical protein [Paraburkholderia atlantica]NUY30052.1 hypothetical protein [Paraburkholderia atlantica]
MCWTYAADCHDSRERRIAASFSLELARHGTWQLIDLPMGGKVRAAATVAQPVDKVSMIGWPKRTAR